MIISCNRPYGSFCPVLLQSNMRACSRVPDHLSLTPCMVQNAGPVTPAVAEAVACKDCSNACRPMAWAMMSMVNCPLPGTYHCIQPPRCRHCCCCYHRLLARLSPSASTRACHSPSSLSRDIKAPPHPHVKEHCKAAQSNCQLWHDEAVPCRRRLSLTVVQ